MTDPQPVAPATAAPAPYAPVAPPTPTNTLAILALVFGILGSVLAVVFGHIALSQITRTGAQGRGLAIAGLILGYLWVVLYLAFFVGLIVYGAAGYGR
jgi:hypothetical protein